MRALFSSIWAKLLRRVSDYSLNRKIALILGLSGLGLILITVVLLAVFDYAFSRRAIVSQYQSLGEVIAMDTTPHLDFEDSIGAEKMLRAFFKNEGLIYGAVFDRYSVKLASIGEIPDGFAPRFESQGYVELSYLKSRIEVMEPVGSLETGERFGTALNENALLDSPGGYVYLVGDLGPIYEAFAVKSLLFVLLLGMGAVLVIWIASRMSRLITVPILELAQTAHRISQDRDFSKRQNKVFNDETGVLVDAFNQMLEQIEEKGAIIRSNEERFREYFELGVAGMAILDSSGRFVEANKRLGELLETDETSLLETVFDDWVVPAEAEKEVGPFQALKERCQPGFSEERWLKGKGGVQIFAIISVRRLAKVLGETDSLYLTLIQDISDRKKAEEALLASKQAAEEANRSKDEFLSVMSHELRTPLNPIIGFVDLLMLTEQNEEQMGMLSSIRRSSEHLLNLITDILEFTRAQGGRLEANPEAFDLPDLCRNAMDIAERSGAANGIEVTLRTLDSKCVPEGVQLFADAGKIRQVVINFLSNAVKYNKDGGKVWLDAKVVELPGEKVEVRIQVEDTGLGISPEMQEFIFEPFTQLDMSLQRKHEGVGLGLSICKRIAECLDGEISVSSEVGKGSVFSLSVPVRYVYDERFGESGDAPKLVPRSPEFGVNRVLLVEDDVENMKLVEAKLRKLGVPFEWAKNGLVATEKLRDSHYDLVLMDVRMPLMDGLEATKVIRESETERSSGRRVPIVAMTAHASERMRSECHEAGMDGYLSKPVQFEQLECYLKRYLASSS
ncbi:ATP-binding protein [Pelagicoccus enzymogenes]|uniref:ATP-binding protein n=1 Tax=Pelagicoccus enzymogenes TaxID=2773457 RepID=UPI00280CFB5A|nr:ATP-binding protein [Pelagicoccus enzymogenes]MDQ8200939.1 ATP-binding protein [Pelagicoccus enzymogenes]